MKSSDILLFLFVLLMIGLFIHFKAKERTFKELIGYPTEYVPT